MMVMLDWEFILIRSNLDRGLWENEWGRVGYIQNHRMDSKYSCTPELPPHLWIHARLVTGIFHS